MMRGPWEEAEMYVLTSLQSIDKRLESIQEKVSENTKLLGVVDRELKIRSTIYGALGSIIVGVILKFALGM